MSNYFLYDISGIDGSDWYLSSRKEKTSPYFSSRVQFRKSTKTQLWNENQIHSHTKSNELYIVLEGQIDLMINNKIAKVAKNEILFVKPSIPHMMIGGIEPLSHIVLKVPYKEDKRIVHKTLSLEEKESLKEICFSNQSLSQSEGYHIDLEEEQHQNCWILGINIAKYYTQELCLAYMDFGNHQTYLQNGHIDTNHYHKKGEEWYLTIEGKQIIQVEEKQIDLFPMHLLRIQKNVPHKSISYFYPFRGITFRTPIISDEKVIIA